MATAVSEDLVEYLEDRAGDYLRSVVHYEEADYEVLYLRDDVAEQYTEEKIEKVIQELKFEAMESNFQEQLYVHGGLGCTLRVFEKAVELHFPYDGYEGAAVALDPEAAQQLHSFVNDCLEQIPHEHSQI